MKRSSIELGVGVFALIGILCIGYLTVKLGKMEVLGDDYYSLNARFVSVAGLRTGTQVVIAGVEVGQVDAIDLEPESQKAIVRIKIKKNVELTDDVIAAVKTSGLIGDKYISLSPGGSDVVLQEGDTIIETESAVDLEELISKYVFGNI